MEQHLFRLRLNKTAAIPTFLLLTFILPCKASPGPEKTIVQGRVVAQAENNAEDLGAGSFFGSSQIYIFELADQNIQHRLVKILYIFRKNSERLQAEFADYSVPRSLTVIRHKSCDASLEQLAYTQGPDGNGRIAEHQFTLKMAKGAPKLTISKDPLPCYTLKPQGLKPSSRQPHRHSP